MKRSIMRVTMGVLGLGMVGRLPAEAKVPPDLHGALDAAANKAEAAANKAEAAARAAADSADARRGGGGQDRERYSAA